MVKRLAIILFLMGALASSVATHAQVTVVNVCPYKATHPLSLACLIPDLTQTGASQNLARFNTTIAQVLGQLPLAAPVSGFVLGFDKATGQFIPLNENLGSVLTERGNTVGRHKLFLGFTYQRFVFQTIDGTKLNNLPSAYFIQTIAPATSEYGVSANSLSANLSQYTGIVAFGLTDRIDISATLPYERVSLSAGNSNVQQAFVTGTTSTVSAAQAGQSTAGSAHGVGDLLINLKGTVINGEKSKVAAGLEARFPTGDEFNLLGTGAYGVKPYVVFSRLGRVTPHVNLGYQWNDFSSLYINKCYFDGSCSSSSSSAGLPTLELPHSLDYSAGADIGVVKRLTIVGDYVGQHYFNAPKVTPPVPLSSANIPGLPIPGNSPSVSAFNSRTTVGVTTGSIDVDNVALGLKVNPVGRLILSANALIRLDTGGLRPDRFVPLIGISYRF